MPPMSSPKMLRGLNEVAHLYRGFLLDISGIQLSAGAADKVEGRALARCARQLVAREKRVAAVAATAQRAASAQQRARSLGFPEAAQAWTSGEFVHRCLASPGAAGRPELPTLPEGRSAKVYELSQIAKPRRWAEFMARGGPPLEALAKSGAIRRADTVEGADLCYWDVYDGDEVPYVEAVLELCQEYRVPLLQPHRSHRAVQALSASAPKGSVDAAAVHLSKIGGTAFGVGKVAGYAAGLGWEEDLAPQDVLLISADIGDVIEAEAAGIDVLLLFGGVAEGQLHAFRADAEQAKFAERKQMSVSQRVAEDSPAMLQAATNPFLSVFQLPALLAEATRKNAEHRAKVRAATDREVAAAAVATGAEVAGQGLAADSAAKARATLPPADPQGAREDLASAATAGRGPQRPTEAAAGAPKVGRAGRHAQR
eukprot:CAMPEP_0170282340 /NCGR_PEP_ID=MMETSP0116_2-20130129/41193_1 /TAXON_ID=400756 /ORGANISM="Durinskia baltica, Strain CSIRO CS-38" /LENGTH=426 /DNA_ID=CAMNT_0010533689 /DNA_START=21 /DNA_END=1298 /DNA_ORIENTATION=-